MRRKVLLMGKAGAGKTSMKSIIFANYIPRDTRRLGATIDVESAYIRFLGNLVLNLWDCGGQEAFMVQYLQQQRDTIFRNVEVLIYVFDCDSKDLEKDYNYYQECLEAIRQYSRNAKIFCLVHKMDLVEEATREVVFKQRVDDLERLSRPCQITCFPTSIWDETLYKAWSAIVHQLIPNVAEIGDNLRLFADAIDADEVILFEKATFLVISSYENETRSSQHTDLHRYEKISNIIKQFKLGCSKIGANFTTMEVRNANFLAYCGSFTQNTCVMVVLSDATISSALILMNVKNAQKVFERLEDQGRLVTNTTAAVGGAGGHVPPKLQ